MSGREFIRRSFSVKDYMKKIIGIFLAVCLFLGAAAGVFFLVRNHPGPVTGEREAIVSGQKLPVMSVEMFGKQRDEVQGFVGGNTRSAGRGDLAVLADNHRLSLTFEGNTRNITGFRYELSDLAGENILSRGELSDWSREGNEIHADLEVNAELIRGAEYRLAVFADEKAGELAAYYLRLVWPGKNSHAEEFLALAETFSAGTFDPEAARDLTAYLETDPSADNTSLAETTLKNSFDVLTWKGLPFVREDDVSVHLRELQGMMGCVKICYTASLEDEGVLRRFKVAESFTMRYNPQRIYLMDYDRKVTEIFAGGSRAADDKGLLIGITPLNELEAVTSEEGGVTCFTVSGDLWASEAESGNLTRVFSFSARGEEEPAAEPAHRIRILGVTEDRVDFLVFGYMGGGDREGSVGTALYRYDFPEDTLTERLFLPSAEDVEKLIGDIERLSYLNAEDELILYMNRSVARISPESGEVELEAENLNDQVFQVSGDHARIAWQEGKDILGAKTICTADLEEGTVSEIHAKEGDAIRLIGFVGRDLVYTEGHLSDRIVTDGRISALPWYSLEIAGEEMNMETSYRKSGIWISDVELGEGRVRLSRLGGAPGAFVPETEDTLVCNDEKAGSPQDAFTSRTGTAGKEVLLEVRMPGENSGRVIYPEKVLREEERVITLPAAEGNIREYTAYSAGEYCSTRVNFTDAVQDCYDHMGIVTDDTGFVCWARADRRDSASVRDPAGSAQLAERYLGEYLSGADVSEDGTRVLNASGMALRDVLYYVSQGEPVAARLADESVVLITAYDNFNITCLRDPFREGAWSEKVGLKDAADWFLADGGNHFLCFLKLYKF